MTLSAQQSAYFSLVRRPNPALSSLEERWNLLCSSILSGFWAWWVCPSHVWNFPFHWQWLICAVQNWSDANTHTHEPRHPYELSDSTDKVLGNVESLQKDIVACCRKQQGILLSFGLPLRSTDATVCPRAVHVCVCLFATAQECSRCLCLRCPWKVSLTANLALPYLPTSMPPQLASNQYLLRPAMNCYEPLPHLCSAT